MNLQIGLGYTASHFYAIHFDNCIASAVQSVTYCDEIPAKSNTALKLGLP